VQVNPAIVLMVLCRVSHEAFLPVTHNGPDLNSAVVFTSIVLSLAPVYIPERVAASLTEVNQILSVLP
jgi:hypothetical protein